jgi:Ca2+-transporting ATPase
MDFTVKNHKWHSKEIIQILKELDVEPDYGLTDEEVKNRLKKYGYNEIQVEQKKSPFKIFINQFKNILIIILLIAVFFSAIIGHIIDTIFIVLMVLLCVLLGFIQEYKAEKALEALKKMLSPTITVIRNGEQKEVLSKELVPGDILILEAGDKIPADARLIDSYFLKCDESSLTGESLPVDKNAKALSDKTSPIFIENMVFSGSTVVSGRGKAVVIFTGMNTQFGEIAKKSIEIKEGKTPFEKQADEVGKWLGIIALIVCVVVAGTSIIKEILTNKISSEFIINITIFAVSLAVASVPEALAAIVTGCLAIGMYQISKKNALVRKMAAVETLGCTTVICSDKTGTITKGEMTVRKIFISNNIIDVTGTGYSPKGEFKYSGMNTEIKKDDSFYWTLRACLLCNDSNLYEKDGEWFISGDPTEGCLLVLAGKAGINIHETRLKNPRIGEIPFSSERKRMTTIHQIEDGRKIAFMKGAPEVITQRSAFILENNIIRKLNNADKANLLKINEEMSRNGLRVLGIAYKEISNLSQFSEDIVEQDLIFLGFIGMIDPPREEVIEAIKKCKIAGIKTIMITGDHKLTAMAIAKEIGIYKDGDIALTGEELEGLSDEEFEKIVDKVKVYARVSPLNKLKIVKAWKKKGEVVAMTGDGVNDAPALKEADIGISMGITGTELTKEASDMILKDDNFATIVKAVELGRWIYDNIKKYLTYLLRCNITEVAVIGGIVLILGPQYLPLLPAAILYINLATDGLPALALGVAPQEPDIMKMPPRNPKEKILSWDVKALILSAVLIDIPLFYLIFFHKLSDISNARTELFFLFVIIELMVALNFRSLRYSILKSPPHKLLILAVIWELILVTALINIPYVRIAFGINKPSISDLSVIFSLSIVISVLIEIFKVFLRKRAKFNVN